MNKLKFKGSGLNGSGFLAAISNSFRDSSGIIPPVGATWPFARLSINKKVVELKMPYISKRASRSEVTVSLSKLGYFYFLGHDRLNDFGFATFKMNDLIRELRAQGFRIDKSCKQNLLIAKISLYTIEFLTLGGFTVGIVALISAF